MLQCMFQKKPWLDLLPVGNVLRRDFKIKDIYYIKKQENSYILAQYIILVGIK